MALTVNAVTSFQNRAVLNVVNHVWDVGKSLPFQASYLVADSYGSKYLYPGMIVSEDETNGWYVPANVASSYGAYSGFTYACGVIYTEYDCTFENQIVAPATRAAVIEANCYIHGVDVGTAIPDAVKSAIGMKLIQWD